MIKGPGLQAVTNDLLQTSVTGQGWPLAVTLQNPQLSQDVAVNHIRAQTDS